MTGVHEEFRSHSSRHPKNVYGISIYMTTVRDTTMLSARFTSADYPTTADLYRYFDVLKKSDSKTKGNGNLGFPIVNLKKTRK